MRTFESSGNKFLIRLAIASFSALFAALAGCGVFPRFGEGEAKNVILIVGDGMGAAQLDAVQLASVGAHENLAMDILPHAGLVGTNSASRRIPITDSAAAATAMASGVKTANARSASTRTMMWCRRSSSRRKPRARQQGL